MGRLKSTMVLAGVLGLLLSAMVDVHAWNQTQRTIDWVRTTDGWQSRSVLQGERGLHVTPALHPALVAVFQLWVSIFALLAFPAEGAEADGPAETKVKRVRIRRSISLRLFRRRKRYRWFRMFQG